MELIDDISAKQCKEGDFDFAWEFTALYPVTVVSEVLGVPTERRAEFKHWVDDILAAANRSAYGPARLAEIEASSKKTRQFFEELYDEWVNNIGDDLIYNFITDEVDGDRKSKRLKSSH